MHYATWAPLTAFTTALLAVWWLTRNRFAQIALDRPNERSLHATPMPRTGGLGLHAGILTAWPLAAPGVPMLLWAPLLCVIAVSLLDDLYGIPAIVRLATHLFAASLVASSEIPSGPALVVVSTLAIAWMSNLYNFMDGSDGLAGGMTLFGFSFYGIAALLAGNVEFALLNFSIAAAAAGFLVFNFHPARIFMGDVGSVPLGFLAATLGLVGWQNGHWTWWFPLLVFSPFIMDASITLARRIVRRERVWQAHRDHYYQRLVQMGWGHRNTALAEYGLMAVCGLCAVASLLLPGNGRLALIAVLAITYLVLALAIERAWHRFPASR